MTQDDKILFLHFITRTGMYINPVDENTIVSFIHGYNSGTQNKCDYTELSKKLFSEKYKTSYSSDGWPGQIKRYAEKKSLPWVEVFKKTALEIIANECGGSLNEELKEILKTRIIHSIDQIRTPFYDSWPKNWQELNPEKSKWFDELWSKEELKILRAITKEIIEDNIFSDVKGKNPSDNLLKLKDQFNKLIKTN